MIRIAAFIDGFNLYHSVREVCPKLKWLNYFSLAEAFIAPSKEQLVDVFYFTAVIPWDAAKASRHKFFIRAQELYGVKVIYGKFKEVSRECRLCHKQYKTYEEKETDVNIAVKMLLEAGRNTFDKILLFSGDSDMIAGVKALKDLAPHKHIKVITPMNRSPIDLRNHCHSSAKIKLRHLQNNQLPDTLTLPDGTNIFKPMEWS